jgi:hypothetical protein
MTQSQLIPGFNFEWKHRVDAYATHQPVLYEAVKRTDGPIVELGCGFNSTQLIHEIAGERTVWSVEHDREWMARFEHLATPKRRFILINNYYEILTHFMYDADFGMVFIDQGDWDSRAQCIPFFKNRSKVVVVHDSDHMENHGFLKYADHYKYVKTFLPLQPYPYVTGPPTALLSNEIDITTWNINYDEYK